MSSAALARDWRCITYGMRIYGMRRTVMFKSYVMIVIVSNTESYQENAGKNLEGNTNEYISYVLQRKET